MTRVVIKEPIWRNGGMVGISDRNLDTDTEIEIIYKNMLGERLYPNVYHIERERALKYPIQIMKSGTVLRIIPIKDLERR